MLSEISESDDLALSVKSPVVTSVIEGVKPFFTDERIDSGAFVLFVDEFEEVAAEEEEEELLFDLISLIVD